MGLATAETLRAATLLRAPDGLLFGDDRIEDVADDGSSFWIAAPPARVSGTAERLGAVGAGGSAASSAAPVTSVSATAGLAASAAAQQLPRDASFGLPSKPTSGAGSMPSPECSTSFGRDAASPRAAVARTAVAAAALHAAKRASAAPTQPPVEFDIHVRSAAGAPTVPMRVSPSTTFGELVGLIAKKDAFPKQHIRLLVDGREHSAEVTLAEAGVAAGSVLQQRLAPSVGYGDID